METAKGKHNVKCDAVTADYAAVQGRIQYYVLLILLLYLHALQNDVLRVYHTTGLNLDKILAKYEKRRVHGSPRCVRSGLS